MEREMQLDRLQPGGAAVVSGLEAQDPLRRRLQDIGLIRGTQVECVGVSPLGDPAAYLIRGAVIALRGKDASCVRVERASTLPQEQEASGLPHARRGRSVGVAGE